MDILGILNALKGKALDLKDIELLKHAYELQEQNIEQLKTNNEARRETIDLLKEKLASKEVELTEVKTRLQSAQRCAEELESIKADNDVELSHEQHRLLALISEHRRIHSTELAHRMEMHVTEVEHNLDILDARGLISRMFNMNRPGCIAVLKETGRAYVVEHKLLQSKV